MLQRILVVEDTPEMQILIRGTLGSRYAITCVSLAADALAQVQEHDFDLILLDVGLPDSDGFRLCARLQQVERTAETPIIFITGKSDVSDKVLGFSVGADDYVVKPFDPLELKARIESKLERLARKRSKEGQFTKGFLRFNIPFQRVYVARNGVESEVRLTPNEFKLLYFMARHEGHLLNRERLLNAVWGSDTHVVDRTVDTHIYTLRRKLADNARYIESVPGEGYRFVT